MPVIKRCVPAILLLACARVGTPVRREAPPSAMEVASASGEVRLAQPPAFRRDDHVIALVSGNALQSMPFGYSGTGTLYRATGNSAFSKYTFSVASGAQDVALERRSAKDITNRKNYGADAYIPPGIYFLHFHRMDPSHGPRERLGLGDSKCSEIIAPRPGGAATARQNVQFHVAFNDLSEFNPQVSQGCITASRSNFDLLFPSDFFGGDSPINNCPQDADDNRFAGNGDILVFVTDASDNDLQNRQLAMFRAVVRGDPNGLTPAHFAGGNELAMLRTNWYTGIP